MLTDRLARKTLALAFSLALATTLNSQSTSTPSSDLAETRRTAMQLYAEGKKVQAVPLFEQLAATNEKDVVVMERLGDSLYASSIAVADPAEKKRLSIRALVFLRKAKELGDNSSLMQLLLENIPAGGSAPSEYSNRSEADAAMKAGEAAFNHGEMDKAVDAYQQALSLDPKLYLAALFVGDAYFKSNRPELAGNWFAK